MVDPVPGGVPWCWTVGSYFSCLCLQISQSCADAVAQFLPRFGDDVVNAEVQFDRELDPGEIRSACEWQKAYGREWGRTAVKRYLADCTFQNARRER